MNKLRLFSLSVSLILFCIGATSCSSAIASRDTYATAYRTGNIRTSEAVLDKTIAKEMPTGSYTDSGDSTWLLLDRATARFTLGDARGAINDYHNAIEAFDFYGQDLLAEAAGQVLLQDELGAYQGEDFEHILARFYLALALLHEGDENNAYAILRQAEELQQLKREEYGKSPITEDYKLIDNAALKYLFAALLEHRGDSSNANILYKEASTLAHIPTHRCCGDRATVLVFCHNGNAPYKISTISDASVASTIALELLLASQDIDPALSCLSGIPSPELVYAPFSSPQPTQVTINDQCLSLVPIYDVARTAEQQLNQKIPYIVARGAARYLLRRGATAYMNEQDPLLGSLCDFGMFVANLHTKADTRSWLTLPATVECARYDLHAGSYPFFVTSQGYQSKRYTLDVKPGDFCVINIFHTHPGIITTLIPKKFIKGENL